MKVSNTSLLNKRVLKLNVGFLLSTGAGNSKDIPIDINAPLRVADDLTLNYLAGLLRLSRNKEGLLVQGELQAGIDRECSRCMDLFEDSLAVHIEELYAYPQPIADTEFFIGKDANLDLAPLVRAEVLIRLSHKKFCRSNCKGLCSICGTNFNEGTCQCDHDIIDPRMAKLQELLNSEDR